MLEVRRFGLHFVCEDGPWALPEARISWIWAPLCMAKWSPGAPRAAGRSPRSPWTEPGVARDAPAAPPGASQERPRAPRDILGVAFLGPYFFLGFSSKSIKIYSFLSNIRWFSTRKSLTSQNKYRFFVDFFSPGSFHRLETASRHRTRMIHSDYVTFDFPDFSKNRLFRKFSIFFKPKFPHTLNYFFDQKICEFCDELFFKFHQKLEISPIFIPFSTILRCVSLGWRGRWLCFAPKTTSKQ